MVAPFASALPETGDASDEGAGDEKSVTAKVPVTSPTLTATPSPTPTAMATTYAEDEEEEEETVATIPTLEREAPPRPNATMAKAHNSHDRPLVQSGHPLVGPASTLIPDENDTETPSVAAAEPDNGLFVRGVGVLLTRTPEDVVLTRSGVEIANLDWLLDPAMRLGARHPRAALEGETFTVTVTVEARNMTLTGGDPAYVILVPPPDETGVYEITRTREPQGLRDGERDVWEFSVVTRTGRLTLADLTLPEERLVTNLTSNPDVFAFRAYALAGDQEIPSTGVSDPVIAIRTDEAGVTEESSLPGLYALAGVQNSTLGPSETMAGAWQRGVGHDTIIAGAIGHLGTLGDLGKEEVTAVYAEEGGAGAEEPAASSSSLFDLIAGFFSGLFG